ncbi:MAG: hypothetical protein O4750_10335 [Trichodesmium sp. St18_bin3_1_1]|nr:hypothetical protein [Trichodesmium sp. St18_bin3_1_1]
MPEIALYPLESPKLNIVIPVMPITEGIYLIVDFTGIKVYGEEEWKTRIYRFW